MTTVKPECVRIGRVKANSGDSLVAMSNALRQEFGLPSSSSLQLRVGGITVNSRVRYFSASNRIQKQIIFCSPRLLAELHLPLGIRLGLAYNKAAQHMRLGPVLGLYAVRYKDPEKPYGKMTSILQELMTAGREKGVLVYAFSPGDVDFNRNVVQGGIYDFRQKKWLNALFPFPDAVYDRISSRTLERRRDVQHTKDLLRKVPGLHYFNPHFLGKWEVYSLLASEHRVERFLPYTRLYREPQDVIDMLERFGQVFLKPAQSSQGLGIVWIWRAADDSYTGQFIGWNGREIDWRARDQKHLAEIIQRIVSGRCYIVQQGLRLARYDGRPCDIRLLMQKDHQGQWRLTTSVGRVAGDGSRISNLGHGGSLVSVYRLFKRTIGTDNELFREQKAKLIAMGKTVSQALENAMGESFAELGLDVAVDIHKNLWLIEVNSKPARSLGDDNDQPRPRARLSVRRIMDYVRYLTGFCQKEGCEDENHTRDPQAG